MTEGHPVAPSTDVVFGQPAPVSSDEGTDPLLLKFEDFLKNKLRDEDIIADERTGALLYNVNQAAYAIEEGKPVNSTWSRVQQGLAHMDHIIKRIPPSNKGNMCVVHVDCSMHIPDSIFMAYDTDIPFAQLEDVYWIVLSHLKGSKADTMREESTALFSYVRKGTEDRVEEHLTAWAQCNLIPMFTCRDRKAFSKCSYRPDFLWTLPHLAVMLECDLRAHANYDKEKEVQRMQALQSTALQEGYNRVAFIRFNPSLKGLTQAFKFTTLQLVLSRIFSSESCDKPAEPQCSSVYLFYPGVPHVWSPVDGLLPKKRSRTSDPESGFF